MSAWGFVPEWAERRAGVKPLINARAETVATKPTFRQAFRSKRCLVLADGFYEWKRAGKSKVPHRVALKSGDSFAFAGIWSTVHDPSGRPYMTFAILTTEANEICAPVHDRMPVVLDGPEAEAMWLSADVDVPEAEGLLLPFPSERVSVAPANPAVNNAGVEGAELLTPPETALTPPSDSLF